MSQMALYSQVVLLWQALAQQQGSAASAIVQDGLHRVPYSQQQPKGSCKILFENHPSGYSSQIEDVGLNWDWVVDAVDGEDNRRQGIDRRT